METMQKSIIKVDGRFQVNLPWKKDEVTLPDSRPMALQRLKCLERKLLRNRDMIDGYQKEIDKLLEKGYCIRLQSHDMLKSPKLWFLPHFPVLNPNKPDKMRLVFDAAAKCDGANF